MSSVRAAIALAPLLLVLALPPGQPVTYSPAPRETPVASASATPAPAMTLMPLRTSVPDATASPSPSKPKATPKPERTADTTLGVRRWQDPAKPPPLPRLSDKQKKRFGQCLDKQVTTWSKGHCAELVQKELRKLGYLASKPTPRIGVSATNAILRYQRSRDLKPTGTVSKATWYALASGKPARSKKLPAECKLPGVVLCVDQGNETLRFVKDGKVRKTVKIRTGGYTSHAKTGQWRVFPTANGLFKVYALDVNPHSENYGSGAMPYSVIFDPNMYVHYSSDFRRRGYSTSSHGCVNVGSLEDAKWIFKRTPIGARVYIY